MIIRTLSVALLLLSYPAMAMEGMTHGDHDLEPPVSRVITPEQGEWDFLSSKMHNGMSIPLTGDADEDFLRAMIPHHQGAIDMANWVLKYGKDQKTRDLAQAIIKAQTAEIEMMQGWLKKD